MTEPFRLQPGDSVLVLSLPHVGVAVPAAMQPQLSEAAAALPDTDWHVDRLYDFASELGASVLTAHWSRYVVDLNRDPDGRPLYPGADNSELCPTRTFDNQAVYAAAPPAPDEIARRVETYWRPYHRALQATLEAVHARHGQVVLLDGHSIRSRVPRFFEGRLPDLNFGTARGRSVDRRLAVEVYAVLEQAVGFRAVRDGRFTGGYITRHYGRPADGRHAMQLELAQASYMEEHPPYRYRPDLARKLKPVLRGMLEAALAWSARQPPG